MKAISHGDGSAAARAPAESGRRCASLRITTENYALAPTVIGVSAAQCVQSIGRVAEIAGQLDVFGFKLGTDSNFKSDT